MSPPPAALKIYHIVHHDKLAAIIQDQVLMSDSRIRKRAITGTTIGMGSIKQSRLSQPVHCHSGYCVGDFVPFYFCPRSVMLYVIYRANHPHLAYRGGQDPIVHLEADLDEVIKWAAANQRRWAFSASNAAAQYTNFFNDTNDLDKVDWNAVSASNWAAPEVREAKQAEFLMHSSFPWSLVRRIGVRSQAVYAHVSPIIQRAHHVPKLEIKPDWYY